MHGPGGHRGGPGGPGGHRGPGGPGFGGPRPPMGGHHRPPMGGHPHPPMGHRPPPPRPPMGGGMWDRPPRTGCCGCLLPIIALMGLGMLALAWLI